MEPINSSLKNIIQFILCVQDACDKHRKIMECFWQQEYSSYLQEWKPCQDESKSCEVKKNEVKSQNASKCVQIDSEKKAATDADLELTLVDSLLEKARNIRTKNKKIMNGLLHDRNLSTLYSDKVFVSSVSCDLKQVPEKVKVKKMLPQSKSDIMINNHKSYVVPRSKSANIPFMSKNRTETVCNSKSSTALSSKTQTVKHSNSAENSIDKDFAVISSTVLEKLKNLQLKPPSCHDSEESKNIQPSDASKNRSRHRSYSHPSTCEFSNLMKDRLSVISCEVKLKMWYPFLSSKNESFLTSFSCNSFSSIKRVSCILHTIQETMIWIDLLYLLETEICPILTVDMTDMNSLRIYSYLHSIYHPNLKRTPIIFPTKNKSET